MSIASEITRLRNVREDIFESIKNKGVNVPSTASYSSCPELIDEISIHSSLDVVCCSATSSTYVLDENNYIGIQLPQNFISGLYQNYAFVDYNADYSNVGSGTACTFSLNPSTTSIGGKTYNTRYINGKTWLCENLDLGDIPEISEIETDAPSNISIPASWYYLDDSATYGEYGRLYNGYAMQYLNDHRQELFPGWKIPTIYEWENLFTTLDSKNGKNFGLNLAQKLKISGTEWNKNPGIGLWDFNLRMAGERSVDSSGSGAYKLGKNVQNNGATSIWSSTIQSQTSAKIVWVNNNSTKADSANNPLYNGYSIRLISDD